MKKRPIVRMALATGAALLGLVVAPVFAASAASAAPLSGGGAYTCTGGDVPPGSYSSVLITGICYAPAGTIVVSGNLSIAPGALFDAVTPGDPPDHPTVPATVLIGGNVNVGTDAVLALGCSPNISCGSPPGISFDRVGGNLTAIGAEAVVVHSATIGGSVSVLGGGGGAAGGAGSGECFVAPIPKPWSLDPGLVAIGPQYTDFEDNFVGGSLTIIGHHTCWLGSIRNQVAGSMTYSNNITSDPDGMEIDNNLTNGNMACAKNDPAVQFGDSGAAPNIVARSASGECAFRVVLPNPAPEAEEGPGVPEHITVNANLLRTYFGSHTATTVAALPPTKTESGYFITAVVNNFKLTGNGLTGTGTVNLHKPLGSTGEALLSTVFSPGSAAFIAYDTCNKCSFGGQSGSTTLRFYGTVKNGVTSGTFLVTAGGALIGLHTLAGWGTFTSAGQPAGTWSLVEYLANT